MRIEDVPINDSLDAMAAALVQAFAERSVPLRVLVPMLALALTVVVGGTYYLLAR